MGFDGQPVTQMLCVDAPVPTGGLGFTVMSDQIGAQKTSAFALNYAFRLLLPNSGSVAAGFSAGWLQNTLDGQVYRSIFHFAKISWDPGIEETDFHSDFEVT